MMLSTHFSLEELVASEVATRRGLDNTPPNEVMRNLSRLAEGLELVRAALGNNPIHVTSGYRSKRLNQMVGAATNSMHTQGLAADIRCPAFGQPLEVCRALATSRIPVDQIIHEFGRWCHTSASRPMATPPATNCSRSQIGPGATSWVCEVCGTHDTGRAGQFPRSGLPGLLKIPHAQVSDYGARCVVVVHTFGMAIQ